VEITRNNGYPMSPSAASWKILNDEFPRFFNVHL